MLLKFKEHINPLKSCERTDTGTTALGWARESAFLTSPGRHSADTVQGPLDGQQVSRTQTGR